MSKGNVTTAGGVLGAATGVGLLGATAAVNSWMLAGGPIGWAAYGSSIVYAAALGVPAATAVGVTAGALTEMAIDNHKS